MAYIPFHGDEHYVDSEFFRRIRAQYYILNAVEINRRTLNALMDGKQQWERNEPVPTKISFCQRLFPFVSDLLGSNV